MRDQQGGSGGLSLNPDQVSGGDTCLGHKTCPLCRWACRGAEVQRCRGTVNGKVLSTPRLGDWGRRVVKPHASSDIEALAV